MNIYVNAQWQQLLESIPGMILPVGFSLKVMAYYTKLFTHIFAVTPVFLT